LMIATNETGCFRGGYGGLSGPFVNRRGTVVPQRDPVIAFPAKNGIRAAVPRRARTSKCRTMPSTWLEGTPPK